MELIRTYFPAPKDLFLLKQSTLFTPDPLKTRVGTPRP